MKTTPNQLLGAALCLLATATTAPAAGKGRGGNGGGGSGGGTLEGTIYYYGNAAGWNGTPSISMNPDGSNQTVLGSGGYSMIRAPRHVRCGWQHCRTGRTADHSDRSPATGAGP